MSQPPQWAVRDRSKARASVLSGPAGCSLRRAAPQGAASRCVGHTAVGPWVVKPFLKTHERLSFAFRVTSNISDSLPWLLQALPHLDLAPADCDLVCQHSGSSMPLQSLRHSCCSSPLSPQLIFSSWFLHMALPPAWGCPGTLCAGSFSDLHSDVTFSKSPVLPPYPAMVLRQQLLWIMAFWDAFWDSFPQWHLPLSEVILFTSLSFLSLSLEYELHENSDCANLVHHYNLQLLK